MLKNKDILLAEEIKEKLNNKFCEIIVLDTVDSTNEYAKYCIPKDTPEMSTVIAKTQTAGRGRFKRKFYSPDNCGVYMSVLLKPDFKAADSVLITAAAAVAVSEACEALSGKQSKIKWVNDILIDNKKACGILCEGVFNPSSNKLDRVVLGIGINAYKPQNDFEDEIKDKATFVFDEERENRRNTLIAEILNRFEGYYKNLDKKSFLEEYRKKSAVVGKEITVLRGDEKIPAFAVNIEEDCGLLVKYADKTMEKLSSGEISIRVVDN